MKNLRDLIKNIEPISVTGETNIKILGISADSRKVSKSDVFVAITGMTVDSHDFIPEAIKKGAVAIIGQKDVKVSGATYIRVKESREALSLISSAWYDYPAKKLKMVGVTGTDGKTTTSTLIYWILNTAGFKTGLITSISAKIGQNEYDTGFHVTNPEPLELHKFLKRMVDSKCEYAVIEVTSHGLDQKRVSGIPFEVGVLTNITHEHLDYHKTFKNYVLTKAKLFQDSKVAVLNKKDSSFGLIAKHISQSVNIIPYPQKNIVKLLRKSIEERFPESYNRLNAEAAYWATKTFGLEDQIVSKAILSFPQVKGRLEEIKNNKGFNIYIDFAHTPNALKEVLSELKKISKGKLISVFGCASQRDVFKRPMMGKISTSLADFSIFTSEDPRKENPENIISQIASGAVTSGTQNYIGISKRGEAIYYAINKVAKRGDTVVICGKGHEKSMAYGGKEYPWSDFDAVKAALKGKIKTLKR